MKPEFIEAAVDLARLVPATQIRVAAQRLLEGQTPEAASRALGTGSNRELFLTASAAWLSAGAGPESLASALLAASRAHEAARQEIQLELVWTGPIASRPTMRRTEQALLELIESATDELLLVSFVTYEVASIRKSLVDAIERGVKVTLVAESTEHNDTVIDQDPRRLVGRKYADRMTVLVWASKARLEFTGGRPGKLHAKFAIADRRRLLLGSANLTQAALARNIEAGVLVTGGRIPPGLCAEIEHLQAAQQLSEWDESR